MKSSGGMATAMAIGGRAARPCDVCGRDRARWYCAADEAYLCEPCDGSVHNANALASRHERVRLSPNGAPMKIDRHRKDDSGSCGGEPAAAAAARLAISSKRKSGKDAAARAFRDSTVPVTLQSSLSPKEDQGHAAKAQAHLQAFDVKIERSSPEDAQIYFDELPGDPRSPFGSPSRGGEGKGEPDYAHEFMVFDECDGDDEVLTPEEYEDATTGGGMESSAGDFDALSPATAGDEDSELTGADAGQKHGPRILSPLTNSHGMQSLKEEDSSNVPSLRLNYADVLNAWSDRGNVWTAGQAQTVPEDSTSDATANPEHGVVPLLSGADGSSEREARVNRYREKRRNRLFSKKIRYEVRKLNAERRPRMKGRFVKRAAGEQ